MIRFKSITASNFLSFGQQPVSVQLDTKNTRAILGVNDDIGDKGGSANGVGKSAIFNAILFSLFGKGVDKLKTDEFINIVNGKKLVVEVVFEKGDKTYQVRRGRKPNFVELTVDGESLTLDAMKNTDEQIVELLGFDYDIFMASFFLSPHRTSFMAMSGPEQRSMIETMLSLDVLAVRAETLKRMRTDTLVEIKVLTRDIDRTNAANEQILQSVERLTKKLEEFDIENEKLIKSLEEELSDIESIDTSQLEELFDEYTDLLHTRESLTSEQTVLSAEVREVFNLYQATEAHNKKVARLMESSARFETDKLSSTEAARKFIENNRPLDELVTLFAKSKESDEFYTKYDALVIENDVKIRSLEKALTEYQEKKQQRVNIIEGLEHGTCHVCGSDYTNQEELDASKLELTKIEANINVTEALIADEKGVKKELDATVFPTERLPDDSYLKLPDIIAKLKRMHDLIEFSDKTTNDYQKELETIDMDEFSESIDVVSEKLAKIRERKSDIDSRITDVVEKISEYESIFSELRITKKEHISNISSEKLTIKDKIEAARIKANPFEEELKRSKENIVDVIVSEIALRTLEKQETHIGYLIKLLTDSKSFIRRRILENYIPYLNKKINEHAEKLGLPHVCEVNTDLSVSLTYMNRPVSYYNLSRGERLRLDLATTDAFRAMMGMLGKGCNIALLDEVLDSALDTSGRMAALRFICDSAETVLLITHREELAAEVEDKIIVAKRNGFTEVT